MLKNMTPHTITIVCDGEKTVNIPPSGNVARVAAQVTRIGSINDPDCGCGVAGDCTCGGVIVPIYGTEYGEVVDLPAPCPDVWLIVSRLVLQAAPDRPDLLAPGELIRDADGNPVGCRGLSR